MKVSEISFSKIHNPHKQMMIDWISKNTVLKEQINSSETNGMLLLIKNEEAERIPLKRLMKHGLESFVIIHKKSLSIDNIIKMDSVEQPDGFYELNEYWNIIMITEV